LSLLLFRLIRLIIERQEMLFKYGYLLRNDK
jgi:hypothetical protein